MGKRLLRRWLLWLSLLSVLWSPTAHAFCGFFVSGADGALVNDATQVALMRQGTRTVLSMSNSYRGPLGDFALVIPVPVILQKENVRTLPTALFERLGQLTAPRLVEYWEQDPCYQEPAQDAFTDNKEGGTGTRAKGEEGSMGRPRPLVRVEAEFSVDEYEIVILSADDATALESWLRQGGYKIPPNVEPFLRPYVVGGSKFFVARVDAAKVKFLWGRAVLSPLRFHYDSEKFELPIRLGLANADGPQDLLIYLLAPGGQRFEVANYENVFIPTNLEVKDEVRDQFPSFYAALFDRTVAGKPRAVVTEYAWSTGSCDPCPIPPLEDDALRRLGLDVLPDRQGISDFNVTRLHARYSRDTLGDDLVFRPAPPVEGGRAGMSSASRGAVPAPNNAFQGRYILRHPWGGAITCDSPDFGVWGGPPEGVEPPPPPRPTTTVRRDLAIDPLILERPVSGEERLAWGLRGRLFLRHRVLQKPVLPVFAFLLGVIGLSLWAHRLKVSSRPLFAFLALYLVPLLPLGLYELSRPGKLPLGWAYAARISYQDMLYPHALLAVYQGAAALVLAWGVARAAGRRPSPGWALLAASLPLLVGVALFQTGLERTAEALLDPSVGWGNRGRILAIGEGESLQSLVVGLCASALLLAAMAPALLDGPPGNGPPGLQRRAWLAGLVGAVTSAGAIALAVRFLASGGLRFQRHDREGWPLLLLALLFPWAAWVASRAAARWPEDERRPAFLDAVATATLVLALAGLLITLAAALNVHGYGLEWLYTSGYDLTFERRAERFLSLARGALALGVGAVPLALLVALPPGLVLGEARRGAGEAPLAAFSAGLRGALSMVLSAGALAGFFFLRHGEQHRLPQVEGDERLRLPSFRHPETAVFSAEVLRTAKKPKGAAFLVDEGGKLWGSAAARRPLRAFDDALFVEMGRGGEDIDAPPEPLLAVDGRLSVASLRGALAPLLERRQTSYRWAVGIELPGPYEELSRRMGQYQDVFGWMRLRGSLPVEWLERLEVNPRTGSSPRRVLALKPEPGHVVTRWLSGGLGVYHRERREGGRFPRAIREGVGSLDESLSISRDLAAAAFEADEFLVVLPPGWKAQDLGELLLELRWYAEIQVPRARGRRMGGGVKRSAPQTFVLTTNGASFDD